MSHNKYCAIHSHLHCLEVLLATFLFFGHQQNILYSILYSIQYTQDEPLALLKLCNLMRCGKNTVCKVESRYHTVPIFHESLVHVGDIYSIYMLYHITLK